MSVYQLDKTELGLLNPLPGGYDTIPSVTSLLTGTKFNYDLLLAITKQAIESNSPVLDRTLDLFNKIDEQNKINLDNFKRLNKLTTDLYFSLRNTQATEKNIPTYIKQIFLDFNKEIFDKNQTDALIKDSKVIGINTKDLSPGTRSDFDSLDKFENKDITVQLVDSLGVSPGSMTPVTAINTGNSLVLTAQSKTYIKNRKLELIINRVNKTEINQIDLSLAEYHIVEVHASDDGVNYLPLFEDKLYVKDTIIPFSSTKKQYIKIVFYKNSELKSVASGGSYNYKILIYSLTISGTSVNRKSQFVTTSIDPELQSISGIAIDTCDNYQNKDVSIKYYIDFNTEENWKEIRPAGKISNTTIYQAPSFVRFNNYQTNKVIKIKRELADIKTGEVEYQVNLDDDFLKSNQLRVFKDQLNELDSSWNFKDGKYSVWAVYNTRSSVYINGSIRVNGKLLNVPGSFEFSPGVYHIEIDDSQYSSVYNSFVYELVSIEGTLLTLKHKKTGEVITVTDPNFSNIKYTIEKDANFLFRNELKENKDFTIFKNEEDQTNKIRSTINTDLFVLHRVFEEDATGLTFRIKGEYTSLNTKTIPYTDRLIIRCV